MQQTPEPCPAPIPWVWEQYKTAVEQRLAEFLQHDETGMWPSLQQTGGKCLRGGFVMLASQLGWLAANEAAESRRLRQDLALSAAASIEALHWASLVHDDILDCAHMRRGQDSLHIRFAKQAESHSAAPDPPGHFKDGLGQQRAANYANYILLLLGERLSQRYLELEPNPYLQFCSARQLHKIAGQTFYIPVLQKLCQGIATELQLRQWPKSAWPLFSLRMFALPRLRPSLRNYLFVARNKTALLFAYSLKLGGHIAQLPGSCLKLLYQLGIALGMAFQLNDDIQDYMPQKHRGKPSAHDLAQGELTLPAILLLRSGGGPRNWRYSQLGRELLAALQMPDPDKFEPLVHRIAVSPAMQAAISMHQQYLSRARTLLGRLEQKLKQDACQQKLFNPEELQNYHAQLLGQLQAVCDWLEEQLAV